MGIITGIQGVLPQHPAVPRRWPLGSWAIPSGGGRPRAQEAAVLGSGLLSGDDVLLSDKRDFVDAPTQAKSKASYFI